MKNNFAQHPLSIAKRTIAVLLIGMLSGAGCSLPQTQASSLSEQPRTVGWVEKAIILGVETEVDAKLDTGADTTSINAEILEEPDEDTESGGMIKFRFVGEDGKEAIFERPIVRWVRIKARDGGSFRRPVVQMKFCVAGRWVEEEVNLADRDEFNYSVLVGRNMLGKAKLAVDSSQTFTAEPACPKEEAQS